MYSYVNSPAVLWLVALCPLHEASALAEVMLIGRVPGYMAKHPQLQISELAATDCGLQMAFGAALVQPGV